VVQNTYPHPALTISGKVGHRGSFDMRSADLKGGTAFSRAQAPRDASDGFAPLASRLITRTPC
jgi:hypothetical protein